MNSNNDSCCAENGIAILGERALYGRNHPPRFGELCDEFRNAAAVVIWVEKCNKQSQFSNGLQLGNDGSLKTPKSIGWLTSLITM
jgi:hypothetical protein